MTDCPACRGIGCRLGEYGHETCRACRGTGVGPRTRSEVIEARSHAQLGGCCNRFAEMSGCDCLERALPDPVTDQCPLACRHGYGHSLHCPTTQSSEALR